MLTHNIQINVQRNVEIEWTSVASTAEDLMMLPCPGTPLEMLGCLAQEWHPLLQSILISVMIHHIYILYT